MYKRWIFLAGLGVGLVMPAAASAQTSRPVEGPAARPAMPSGPGGGMFGPGGRSFDMLEPIKARLASSDEEWKVIGPKLRKVMAARQATEAAIDPTMFGGAAAGGLPGWGGRGPGGPGFGPDSFSGPGSGWPGGGPGGPGGGPGGPGGFFPPGGPSSRPANDPRAMGGPGGGPGGGGPGWPGGGGPWPGATTRPATTPPAGGMFPQPGNFGPRGSEGFGPRSNGGPGSPSLWGLVLSPIAGVGLPMGGGPGRFPGGFGPPMGGGFGPPMGGGFGPPPGFGGPGGAGMQALMDLLAATKDPKTTPEQLDEKLAAVRAARQKARADLAAAQKDLLELLTSDQEAMLVDLGVLE